MRLYDNEVGVSGDKVNGTASWWGHNNVFTDYIDHTTTDSDYGMWIGEETYMRHAASLSYKITGEPAENLRLGFSAAVPVSYQLGSWKPYMDQYETNEWKEKTTDYWTKTDSHTHTYVDSNESSALSARLDLNFAASYKLIPDRFTVNGGIKATPTVFTHREEKALPNSVSSVTTRKTENSYGSVTTDTITVSPTTQEDKLDITNNWAGFSGMLVGGFMFNFTPNAGLDMGVSTVFAKDGDNTSFTVDLATVNVIFFIKY
jgi:hypothetical protein